MVANYAIHYACLPITVMNGADQCNHLDAGRTVGVPFILIAAAACSPLHVV